MKIRCFHVATGAKFRNRIQAFSTTHPTCDDPPVIPISYTSTVFVTLRVGGFRQFPNLPYEYGFGISWAHPAGPHWRMSSLLPLIPKLFVCAKRLAGSPPESKLSTNMENLKVMANRAGNTLYFAGSAVASAGKEKGSAAFQAVKSTQAFQNASVAAVIGREKVKSTQAFQAASSAAVVGKEKAAGAASVAASAASAGKLKAASAMVIAKNRLGAVRRRSSAASPPEGEPAPALRSNNNNNDKEFYKYEMSEDEKKKKRAQARRRAEKNAAGVAPSSTRSGRSESRSAASAAAPAPVEAATKPAEEKPKSKSKFGRRGNSKSAKSSGMHEVSL